MGHPHVGKVYPQAPHPHEGIADIAGKYVSTTGKEQPQVVTGSTAIQEPSQAHAGEEHPHPQPQGSINGS